MTNEEWEYVEQHLSHAGAMVRLKIDEYVVTLIVEPFKKLQNCISVYVNGKIKVDWIIKDSDVRRRFYQRHTKRYIRINQKDLQKEPKKVQQAILDYQKSHVFEYYYPYWTSFRMMKRHFIRNNTQIEICKNKAEY